jgi:hypothetical protein
MNRRQIGSGRRLQIVTTLQHFSLKPNSAASWFLMSPDQPTSVSRTGRLHRENDGLDIEGDRRKLLMILFCLYFRVLDRIVLVP